jgi:hypothetical protein
MLKNFKYLVVQNRITVNENKILCAKNKSKASWNLINNTIKNITYITNIKLYYNNNLLVDYDHIVNCFLDVFLPPATDDNNVMQKGTLIFSSQQMFLNPTHPFEVRSIILGLPNSNSVGPDGIPTSHQGMCLTSSVVL